MFEGFLNTSLNTLSLMTLNIFASIELPLVTHVNINYCNFRKYTT